MYDLYGNIVKETYADGNFVTYEYDTVGNMTASVDSFGNRTSYSYDIYGNCTHISYPDGTSEVFTYDVENQVVSATGRLGNSISYTYDKVGNITKSTYSTGASVFYAYDADDRLISMTNTLGGETHYEYDSIGRNTGVTDPFGNETSYTYSDLGLLTSVTDANGHTYTFSYDDGGNRTGIAYPDGTSDTWTYDVRGRLLTSTDSESHTTSYTYDDMDRLIAVEDAQGNIWSYEYDELGNISAVTDSLGYTTQYTYDQYGRNIASTNAVGNTATVSYNSEGQIVESTDFGGKKTSYSYDALGRTSSVTDGEGTVSYSYNAQGQLVRVEDTNGKIVYTYNQQGYLATKTDEHGQTICYQYDKNGYITGISSEEGSATYGYDVAGRLVSVEDDDGNITTYAYDYVGNLVETAYSNGITTTYEYNEVNLLTKQVSRDSRGTILASYEYTLGANGERLSCQELHRKVTYTYDELDRLTSETIECNGTTSITRYTYDSNSNRLSMDKDGEVTIYVYNELNQLVQAGDVIYTYDDAGNLVAQSENGVLIATYEYNARNQMIHAQVIQATGMVEESYTYNYLGDRTSKTSNGVTTYYTLDYSTGLSQNIVIEHEGQTTFYVRGFELISGTTEEMGLEETFFYLYDGGNSVRAIADGNGAITDEYIFDAFGNKIAHEGESENEYGFQGEQQDETGLYYLRARYMDPVTGTFTSMDTYGGSLSDPVSLHKYLFANSNPVKYCDPSGHLSLQEMGVNMLIWGIISSVLYVGAATLNDLCRPNSDVTSQFSVSGFIKYVIIGVFTGGIVGSLTGAAFLYLASAGTAGLVIAIYFYFLFALVCFVISTCACQDDYNSSLWFGIGMGFVPLPGKYTGDISGIVADVLQWITEAL